MDTRHPVSRLMSDYVFIPANYERYLTCDSKHFMAVEFVQFIVVFLQGTQQLGRSDNWDFCFSTQTSR